MRNVGRWVLVAVTVTAFFLTVFSLKAEIVQKCINLTDGFSIEFPEGWQIRENPGKEISLIAFRPRVKADEVVFERLSVATLEDAGEDSDPVLRERIASLESGLNDFKLVTSGQETFPGFSSHFLVYTFTDNFITLKVLAKAKQWLVRLGGRTYLITGMATIDSFPEYEAIFRKIAGSFRPAD